MSEFGSKKVMKAIQTTGKIDNQGRLVLDQPLDTNIPNPVRIIVLFEDNNWDVDEDDEPVESVLEGLRNSLQEVENNQIQPVSQLWDGID